MPEHLDSEYVDDEYFDSIFDSASAPPGNSPSTEVEDTLDPYPSIISREQMCVIHSPRKTPRKRCNFPLEPVPFDPFPDDSEWDEDENVQNTPNNLSIESKPYSKFHTKSHSKSHSRILSSKLSLNMKTLHRFLLQSDSTESPIWFDSIRDSSRGICMVDSKGLTTGYHEWNIQILKSGPFLQQIGVINIADIQNINISRNGIRETKAFGVRSMIACRASPRKQMYYCTFNEGNSSRCFRNLKPFKLPNWRSGDVIRVCLDLNHWRIRYKVNGQKIGKVMSLVRDKRYFPVIYARGHTAKYFLQERTQFSLE